MKATLARTEHPHHLSFFSFQRDMSRIQDRFRVKNVPRDTLQVRRKLFMAAGFDLSLKGACACPLKWRGVGSDWSGWVITGNSAILFSLTHIVLYTWISKKLIWGHGEISKYFDDSHEVICWLTQFCRLLLDSALSGKNILYASCSWYQNEHEARKHKSSDFSFHFGCHAVSQHAWTRSKTALQFQTIQVVINSKMKVHSTAKMKEILDWAFPGRLNIICQ